MRVILLMFLSLMVCRAEYAALVEAYLTSHGVYQFSAKEKLDLREPVILKDKTGVAWGDESEGMCKVFKSRIPNLEINLAGPRALSGKKLDIGKETEVIGFNRYDTNTEKWESVLWWIVDGEARCYNSEEGYWFSLGKIEGSSSLSWEGVFDL